MLVAIAILTLYIIFAGLVAAEVALVLVLIEMCYQIVVESRS